MTPVLIAFSIGIILGMAIGIWVLSLLIISREADITIRRMKDELRSFLVSRF